MTRIKILFLSLRYEYAITTSMTSPFQVRVPLPTSAPAAARTGGAFGKTKTETHWTLFTESN